MKRVGPPNKIKRIGQDYSEVQIKFLLPLKLFERPTKCNSLKVKVHFSTTSHFENL